MTLKEKLNRIKDSEGLPGFEVFGLPETITSIHRLQKSFNLVLPNDYREILEEYGQASLFGEGITLTFFSIDEILGGQLHDINNSLRNVFPIGTDDSGQYYFYDIKNNSGFGNNSIGLIDPGNLEWKYVVVLGGNLSEVVDRIITGEDFQEYDMIG